MDNNKNKPVLSAKLQKVHLTDEMKDFQRKVVKILEKHTKLVQN
jgi:hypothetical protein